MNRFFPPGPGVVRATPGLLMGLSLPRSVGYAEAAGLNDLDLSRENCHELFNRP